MQVKRRLAATIVAAGMVLSLPAAAHAQQVTGLEVRQDDGFATLSWDPVPGATDYQIERAPAGAVLPAQIQSGGTGLNIQAASVVILCEPQLKPSIENQAISRAYRMGQARNVLVYRLLCEKSIDERVMELLEEKQKVFDAFADESVSADATQKKEAEIDDKTFGTLVNEEIERINAENAARQEGA